MIDAKTFVVLEGYLHETMEFEMLRGYEARIANPEDRAIRPNAVIIAQLLDGEGQVLVVAMPEVGFPTGCSANPTAPGMGLLRVTMALHPAARQIVLLAQDRLIFIASVGHEPPTVALELEPRAEGWVFQFRASVSQPPADLQFYLADETGRRMRTAAKLSEGVYSVDLLPFAGHDTLRVCAYASRDFRTGEAFSQPFSLPPAMVQGRILEPANQTEWCAGMPGSLIGNLFYENGRAASWDMVKTSWAIDGLVVNDHRQIALCDALPPGEHTVELRYQLPNGNVAVLDRINIHVKEETEAQKEYATVLAGYLSNSTEKGFFR